MNIKPDEEEIATRLRRLSKVATANLDNINCGGCCVFAAMVGRELEALGVAVEIVTPDYGVSPAEARPNVQGNNNEAWDNAGIARGHLAVRFKLRGRYVTFDSNGCVYRARSFGKCSWKKAGHGQWHCSKPGTGLTVSEAQGMADDPNGWNYSFDRSQIPLMQEIVTNVLRFNLEN